jgi:hypothetical protein
MRLNCHYNDQLTSSYQCSLSCMSCCISQNPEVTTCDRRRARRDQVKIHHIAIIASALFKPAPRISLDRDAGLRVSSSSRVQRYSDAEAR